MSNQQLQYYLKEIEYLNEEGKTFAAQYPQIANKLGIHLNEFRDPHIAKLVQSFAFLTGRITQKIDTQFNYINQNILQILAPHLVYDTPSISIFKFTPLPKNAGYVIARNTKLYTDNPFEANANLLSSQLHMRTLYPVALTSMELGTPKFTDGYIYNFSCKAALEIPVHQIDHRTFRIYINTNYTNALTIYKLIFDRVDKNIYLLQNLKAVLTKFKLKPVGFDTSEHLSITEMTTQRHEDNRFSLLYEYMVCYKKFMFFDLILDDPDLNIMYTNQTIIIPLADSVSTKTAMLHKNIFMLNCTPTINIFEGYATPVITQHLSSFERVTPLDTNIVIHSIGKVTSTIKSADTKPVEKTYHNYLDGLNSTDTWIVFKNDDQFMLGLNSQNDTETNDTLEEIITPAVLYYNQNPNVPIGTNWEMLAPISGLKCTHIDSISKSKAGLPSTEYSAAIHALHINYLGQFSYKQASVILNQLLQLYRHLNTDHVNIEQYIDLIECVNTVTHIVIENILTAIPCFMYKIHINPKYAIQAYFFATIFGEILTANALMHTDVKYTII